MPLFLAPWKSLVAKATWLESVRTKIQIQVKLASWASRDCQETHMLCPVAEAEPIQAKPYSQPTVTLLSWLPCLWASHPQSCPEPEQRGFCPSSPPPHRVTDPQMGYITMAQTGRGLARVRWTRAHWDGFGGLSSESSKEGQGEGGPKMRETPEEKECGPPGLQLL